uniref:USP domain-containing protein n=1 Tax=viral metagenome TaxID=1070528 RepID=A0A6C0KX66_9ZZZZ
MQKYQEYNNKGLSGLVNLGNTCYINSCLQVLSHTYELNDFLNKEVYKKKIKNVYDSAMILEWDELRKLMWKENCIISPGKFIKTVQKLAEIKDIEIFTGYSQNDLTEFLIFVIDCFHNSLSREVNMTINGMPENDTDKLATQCFEMIKKMYNKDYSEIWNIFYGTHVSQIISIETNEVLSSSPEPYFIINLPIPEGNKSPTLLDCLNLYVEGEVLEGENAWFNETTGTKQNVKKKLSYWSFPSVLTIDLKRFNSNNRKNQILIDFPVENLDLSNYVIGYKKEQYKYDLYGICNHSGNVNGGHYTASVKNANGKWYHYNDRDVSEIKDTSKLITSKAYCLFYRKKTMH